MADIGGWQPLHDTHAIQVCAQTLAFGQGVGDVAWRKAMRDVQPAADSLGLLEQTSVIPALPPELSSLGFQVPEQHGMVFSRPAEGKGIGERFTITRDNLRYEDFAYVRWRPFRERARKLVELPFSRYAEVSSLETISSEYMDVFIFPDTTVESPDISPLIDRQSSFVAAGAYRGDDAWHCHTGWFERPDAFSRYLMNVNIDIRNEVMGSFRGRVARVHTSAAVQFGKDDTQALSDDLVTWSLVERHMEVSHLKLKALLADIITPEAAKAIALT